MIRRLAHLIASHPLVYDFIQRAVGVEHVHRRMVRLFEEQSLSGLLIDVGGGTGINRNLWAGRGGYVCIDLDPMKLRGFRAAHPNDSAIEADATRLPLADEVADVVLCKFVTHHLSDEQLRVLLREARRALKPAGQVIVIDPVWAPSRRGGKLLWKYDRGSFPRTAEQLEGAVAEDFTIGARETFAVWHEYVILAGSVKR